MNCISFPKLFSSNNLVTDIKKGYYATLECLKLLLNTEKGSMFGDPDFGIRLRKYWYEQNSYVIKDILIDEIFDQIRMFIPQITVQRRDITIIQERNKLTVHIKAINKSDFQPSSYDVQLMKEEER